MYYFQNSNIEGFNYAYFWAEGSEQFAFPVFDKLLIMERRNFIKTSCKICLLGTIGATVETLTGCGAAYPVFKTAVIDKKITVPLSLFATNTTQFIRPKGWYYDIAVQKTGSGYTSLLLMCTHQDNQLDINGNKGYSCTLHGSTFSTEGKVLKGPAEKALKRYNTVVEGDQLIILV